MNGDVVVFLAMVICGVLILLLLDIFRAFRIVLRPGMIVVAVSDILFCFASLFLVLAAVWNLNSGEFRIYEPVGLILGGIFYFLLLSRWILAFFLLIIKNILKFIQYIFKILLTPSLFLYKILIVPIITFIKNKVRKGKVMCDERVQEQDS